MTTAVENTESIPLVSVIIPSYNHAQYLETAIKSVLAQTYENIELIVVDDGSRDDSHAVISRYSNHPKVTTILNEVNRGQSAVFNQAISIAKGKFIALLPSDDWFLPHKISAQVSKMESSADDVGVVYSAGARYYEDTGETIKIEMPVHTGWIARELLEWGNFIYPITPLYRREVFEKVRPSEQFKAEGEAIHLRIALYYRYEYVDDVLAVMRDHSYNIGKNAVVMLDEVLKHREWFFNLPELPEEIRKLKTVSLSRIYRVKGMQLILDRGEGSLGRKSIINAIRIDPNSIIRHPKLLMAIFLSFLPPSFLSFTLSLRK